MALLQISEPGFAPDPHQRRLAVGIDLGTTHSLVATVRSGVAECLPDDAGRTMLPSAVRYVSDHGRDIGYTALAAQHVDTANTIVSAKRLMGRSYAEVKNLNLTYALVEQPGMVGIATRAGTKSPVEVSAELLATLRQRAEDTLDDDVFGAVITVPAYFDDAQRQATKDAAKLAGINVLRLINEPTAAAIAYGLDQRVQGVYAVYDLGGGTFDISILRLEDGVFEVLATGGNTALGGDDYDHALAAWVQSQLPTPLHSSAALAAVLQQCRAAKEALSEADSVRIELLLPPDGQMATPIHWAGQLTRVQFDALTEHLTRQTLDCVRGVLRDAKLAAKQVNGVVLVGGSTRMPAVRQAVASVFGQAPLTNINPDEAVAIGAAIQANQLVGNAPTAQQGDALLLLDVIPLSLGIETMGGLVERIVPRNQTIPTAMAQDFTTYQDGQTALALHVVQGERDLVADCRSLARFELRGIPPMAAGAARIRVTFTVDADGLLQVSAKEQHSGVESQIHVQPSTGLADDDIARMLQEGFATAQVDMAARAVTEARVDLQRLLLATRSALGQDADLLDAAELAALQTVLTHSDAMLLEPTASAADLEAAGKQVAQTSEDFAARRMNRSIAQALSGQRIDALA